MPRFQLPEIVENDRELLLLPSPAGHTPLVQLDGDGPGTLAPVVVCEDALDDGRLSRVDNAVSCAKCAIRTQVAIKDVAEAEAARRLARLDPTFQTPVRLLRQML